LSERGVVLAAVSKNNPADARAPFEENPNMVLKAENFAAFEASWEPKSQALRSIAGQLKLGLDSFVFFDDNPAERELVRQHLPEVEVVEVPEDPSGYIHALQRGLWFESVSVTQDDRLRTQQYREEHQRREERSSTDSIDGYLESLEMKATIGGISKTNIDRVVQLIGKTNQFNTTTRRHSRAEVESLEALDGSICLAVRLQDKFGDYGLVSVLLARPDAGVEAQTLVIDTWLMSCRVIGRTLEEFVMSELLTRAKHQGFKAIRGEYVRTKKNELVSDLYTRFGFDSEPDLRQGECERFTGDCSQLKSPQSHVSTGDRS